jgi:hypothetical protein
MDKDFASPHSSLQLFDELLVYPSRKRRFFMVEKPACKQVGPWLKHHLGKSALAPLTSQDSVALSAFAHVVELWGRSDENGRRLAIIAARAIVLAMQPGTRGLAKTSIPCMLDWSHEEQMWSALFVGEQAAGLDRLLRELADGDERALLDRLHAMGFREMAP